ncbi:Rieske 2Fe-2S domain-containing protein [Haloarcula sp. S1AR25-5A]|uniref:Rieske 2Fe-2S domain-containing protein n=1 Tax=Haloarcula terrestris TaxID=2950533 RepID=A0AAE4JFG5_9EURY|nr:Rieske 2Fe-2S domain-containing protein [Haloarcula terrestris]MDS0220293.1 Rieske 2Fe-2S domain-containing protein [Haloarcula terrestris]
MSDPVDVTVDTDDESESVRIHDDDGEIEAGDATVRFSFSGTDDDRTADGTDDQPTDGDDEQSTDGDDPRRIVELDSVPADSTLVFEARDGRRGVNCILHRSGDAVVAWRNSCPHQPEVPLDPGRGAIVRGDQLVCHKHGAQFEPDDGVCTHGPCAGDALDGIEVSVRDGEVYLTDERFERAERR